MSPFQTFHNYKASRIIQIILTYPSIYIYQLWKLYTIWLISLITYHYLSVSTRTAEPHNMHHKHQHPFTPKYLSMLLPKNKTTVFHSHWLLWNSGNLTLIQFYHLSYNAYSVLPTILMMFSTKSLFPSWYTIQNHILHIVIMFLKFLLIWKSY